MRHLGFTGTSDGFQSSIQKKNFIEAIVSFNSIVKIMFHHGDCVGADEQAHQICRELNNFIHLHPPSKYAKRAWCNYDFIEPELPYLNRNRKIVDHTELLIGVSKTNKETIRSGTWSTIRYARKTHKPTLIFYPDGRQEYNSNGYKIS